MAYQYGGASPIMPQAVPRAVTPSVPMPGGQQGQIQPGTITYTTSTGPDGQVVYHPFRAVAASYETPQGIVNGIQWIPADATRVLPAGGMPATADIIASFQRPGTYDSYRDRDRQYEDERRRRKEEEREIRREEKERRRAEREREREREEEQLDREIRRARERDEEDRRRRNSGYGYDRDLDRSFRDMDLKDRDRDYERDRELRERAKGRSRQGSVYDPNVAPYPNTDTGAYPSTYPPPSGYAGSGAYGGAGQAPYPAGNVGVYPTPRASPQVPGPRPVSPYQPGAAPRPVSPYAAPRPVSPYQQPPGAMPRSASPYQPPGALPRSASPYQAPPIPPPTGASPYNPQQSVLPPRPVSPYHAPGGVYPPTHVMAGQPIQRSLSRAPSPAPPRPGYGSGYGAPPVAPGYGGAPGVVPGYGDAPPYGAPAPAEPQPQGAMPQPEGFARPPNLAQPYTRFDPLKIQDMDDFFETIPRMPLVLVPHDVYHEDWIRFTTDLSLAWAGKLPVPDLRPPKRTQLTRDLIELWNTSFFERRGVEVVLYKGRERRSGLLAGTVDVHLPGFEAVAGDVSDDSDSDSSDSSDDDDLPADRYRYSAYGGAYGRQAEARLAELQEEKRIRKERKRAEKKKKRQEKKQRRKQREAERKYALYINSITPEPAGY